MSGLVFSGHSESEQQPDPQVVRTYFNSEGVFTGSSQSGQMRLLAFGVPIAGLCPRVSRF